MLRGIALAASEVPLHLLEQPELQRRLAVREPHGLDGPGEREVRFLWSDTPRLLPVWHEGTLQLVVWGNRRGEIRELPPAGWTRLETVVAGGWARWRPAPVDVPASLGLDGQVWYQVREGARGLLVRDEQGVSRVYLMCERATHYYQVMTRGKWMPVLIGERI